MKQESIKVNLFTLIIISIFFIFLFINSSFAATCNLPGDFCGPMGDPIPDGKVDFNDLMVFATAYGSETGDPNWNTLCDICGYLGDPSPDNKVNFDDLMVFATNYGKECPPEPEMELIEVASEEINLFEGGIIEVTDPQNELFGVRLIIEPVADQKKGLVDELLYIVLHMGLLETCELPEYQGYLISPVVIDTEIKDLIPGLSKIEIPYNEKQLINSAVPLDAQIHVLRTVDIRMPWEELSPEQYIIENNIVTIPINWTDNYPGLYFYTLSVDNAIPPDPASFNDPLPGDLLYKFSKLWPFNINEGWLPGHVGIYVGEKYDEENGKRYNVIEALLGGVQRTHYDDLSKFGGNSIYLGSRQSEYGPSHKQRNKIVALTEMAVGMPYAAPETFTSMIYSGLGRGDWVKGDGNFNCVGLAEAAYEYAGIDLVSDFDEGNQEWSAHDILTPAEQWYQTIPASGTIDQNIVPQINNIEVIEAIDLMNGHWMYTLSCDATDQDGDILTYIWSRNEGEGTFSPNYDENELMVMNVQEIKWVSPSDEGEYTITCMVIDNYGGEDSYDKVINLGGTGPVHNLTQNTYYDTIQAALDDADSGDIIEVSDGIYNESIIFPFHKKIVLQSENRPSSSIVKGVDGFATVTCNSTLDGTTLEGFTITHESGNSGRGINICHYSYLNINNCIISDNSIELRGGGINNNGTLTITGTTISGNSSDYIGGGINNYDGAIAIITESTISNNTATLQCGGIASMGATLTINSCNISNNFGDYYGGGIIHSGYFPLTITGCTISNNSSNVGCSGILLDVQTNQIVNIGGSSENDFGNFNEFINNYITDNTPSPVDHIGNYYGDCHMEYPYNYYTPDSQPPDTPALDDFTYCPFSGNDYDLTWSDESSSGAVSYNVQESEDSTFSNIFSTVNRQTSNTYYTYNHNVTIHTNYYYRVRAKNSEGHYSSWSNTVEVMVSAMPSTSITVETRDHNNTPISGSFSYILYDDNDPDPWTYNCDSGSSTDNHYTFDNLDAGTYNVESYQYNDYTLPAYYGAEVTIYTSALAVCAVDNNNVFIPSEGLKYELYLKDASELWQLIEIVTPGSNNYTFTEIPAGIYKVKSYTYDNFRGEAVDINVPPKALQ